MTNLTKGLVTNCPGINTWGHVFFAKSCQKKGPSKNAKFAFIYARTRRNSPDMNPLEFTRTGQVQIYRRLEIELMYTYYRRDSPYLIVVWSA